MCTASRVSEPDGSRSVEGNRLVRKYLDGLDVPARLSAWMITPDPDQAGTLTPADARAWGLVGDGPICGFECEFREAAKPKPMLPR
jgi:hypothetical protein